MTAIGRALMARPRVILLDEPSMGLAPQLVEEIFEIVQELNRKEGVSFLLAEQNTNIALRYAGYGYILENGRVVMDGEGTSLAGKRGREGVLPRLFVRRPAQLPRRQVLPADGSAGSEKAVEHYDELETRHARSAGRRADGGVAGADRACEGEARPASRASSTASSPAISRAAKALARLPVTRKSDLSALQKEMPPLGGLNATPVEKLGKLFVSPGPIYDPEGRGPNWWRCARGLFAGGFRAGELVVNTFAYHFTPAGSMLESGALALGCTVVPTGTGQTEMQVSAINGLRASGYIGTPSFLKLIVEKADELKSDISSLKKAQVGAEYLPPALRKAMQARGIAVTQMYASADLGLIAYESRAADGTVNEGMILEEALILEICRPAPATRWPTARSARW